MTVQSQPSEGANDAALNDALEGVARQLGRRGRPNEFHAEAQSALLRCQASYFEQVAVLATTAARGERQDVVSATHVENADKMLRSGKPSFRTRVFEATGGLFVGGGTSQVIQLAGEQDPTMLQFSLAIACFIVGLPMLATTLAKSSR